MKSEYFRSAKKSVTEHHIEKAALKPMSESAFFQDNYTEPGQLHSVPSHSAKFDSLVNQIGTVNQGPFKLDQRYLNRLYSSGSNLNLQTPSEYNQQALGDFLQVKTVALSNQDPVKKPKNYSAKVSKGDDKTPKPLLKSKQKLPSLFDADTTAKENKDESVRPNSVELGLDANKKQSRGKVSPPENKSRKQSDAVKESLPDLSKNRQTRSMTQRRSESEGPQQRKREKRQAETSATRTERRNTSTTPRKDNAAKSEAANGSRFGPLQQINEIKFKKPNPISNLKTSSSSTKSSQSTNVSNGLSNRNKATPSNSTFVETRTENKSLLTNKNNLSMSSNNSHAMPSPNAKVLNGVNIVNAFKNDVVNNASGLSKVINGLDVYSNGKKVQPIQQQQQQNRNNVRVFTQTSPQANQISSNLNAPSTTNQAQGQNGIGTLMTNGSALNLRPAYPSLRAEDQPKKKIVYVPPPQSNKYKFYVGGGNNSNLVKRVLAKRDWWEETEFFNTLFNLKWQQSYRGYRYDRLPDKLGAKQLVNHFEYHPEISTKNSLIKNLATFCEVNKMNLFDITPLTFRFDMDDYVNFDKDMQQFAKFFITHNPDQKKYPPPSDKKNQVWYNFDYRKKGSYQQPTSNSDQKVSPFVKPIMHDTFLRTANAWVLKPVGLNRGRGIEVFNTLETLNDFMNECFNPSPKKKGKKEEGSASDGDDDEEEQFLAELSVKSRTFVIQKYIEDPLLINKRKFDIRVWVLVTHDMQLYFFKEGYLRTSSQEFSLTGDEVSNKFIHLTNNAVQKHSNAYGQHENGNQLSFKDFEEYMLANGMEGDFRGKILPRMKEIVKYSMQSVGKMLNPHDRKYCFEVFGYDFMIDNNYTPWLIEVNTNPCLDESSPLLQMLIPRMVDDAFKMTVDQIFPKIIKKPNIQQTKPSISSDKKPVVPNQQAPLNLNLKPAASPKEENGDVKTNTESPRPKEGEVVEVKEGETVEKAEGEKESSESKVHEANAANIADMIGGNKTQEEEKKEVPPVEILEMKPEPLVKSVSSPVRTEKVEETPNVIFSVVGYSDTENMWDYLCQLSNPVPKSPIKKRF